MLKPFFTIRTKPFDLEKFDLLYDSDDKTLHWDAQYFQQSIALKQQFLFHNHSLQLLLLCQLNSNTIIKDPTYGELMCADIVSSYQVKRRMFFYHLRQYSGTKFFDLSRKTHQRRVGVLKHHFREKQIQQFFADIEIPKHFHW